MKALSLGWGTQSFTLAAMVALGELEPVDVAIHADTTHERSDTYDFARRWTPWLEAHGVRVVTVRDELAAGRIWQGEMIPAHTIADGERGIALRTCTHRWKIAPMRRWLQTHRDEQPVEMWLGISLDEVQRMKDSDVKYIENRWPLIDKRMSRWDCKLWLDRHGLEIPPRSACVFCPFHSRSEWRDIRDNAPADWQRAVEVDAAIRKARPPYDLFVNVQRRPLAECDLDGEIEKGQLSLWENECFGICGV
jgi:hypothetical protein